jgi:DNA-binding transcriptional regulator LsrR (DeoR family)
MKTSTTKSEHVEKRRRCLTDKAVARIAVRIFNGENASDIAASLGISASYLSRLLKRAKANGAYRYEVASE